MFSIRQDDGNYFTLMWRVTVSGRTAEQTAGLYVTGRGEGDAFTAFTNVRSQQIILYAVNMTETAQQVDFRFDREALDLPRTLHARDVVTHETFTIRDGRFSLEVLGRRPRVLMIHSDPVPAMGPGVDEE